MNKDGASSAKPIPDVTARQINGFASTVAKSAIVRRRSCPPAGQVLHPQRNGADTDRRRVAERATQLIGWTVLMLDSVPNGSYDLGLPLSGPAGPGHRSTFRPSPGIKGRRTWNPACWPAVPAPAQTGSLYNGFFDWVPKNAGAFARG